MGSAVTESGMAVTHAKATMQLNFVNAVIDSNQFDHTVRLASIDASEKVPLFGERARRSVVSVRQEIYFVQAD
jgi:hypothetical protein